MSNRLLAALAGIATLALVSCGAPTTRDFVRKAATSDMYEVEAGKIASEKGQSDAVKQFGQHMVEAHGKTTEELKSILEAEKLTADLPAKLDNKHQKMLDELTAAKPEAFDRTYAAQQVKAHKKAADLFDEYAEGGANPALKQFAANVLPTIKQHLDAAKKLTR